MYDRRNRNTDEVEHLLLNAQLRDELEPYLDESVNLVDVRNMTTPTENEFLASMLAWERAPILPISKWFDPELTIPSPETLTDDVLPEVLNKTIRKLYSARIILEFTEHLSDRELFTVIFRDILPSPEKKVDLPKNYLHWHCIDDTNDEETWLRYYASEEDRELWAEETGRALPDSLEPPFRRKMPRRPS